MKVLVDTSVWSVALRATKKRLNPEQMRFKEVLTELILEGRVEIIGAIRQEMLSGIREQSEFLGLREELRLFDDAEMTREDYEQAARMFNDCRMAGITGSPVDLLICAVALNRKWQILTADKDFQHFASHVHVSLFQIMN
ncbi:MAG: PIN domain nuclease [Acidobacteria bacterium]|nr:PIN domain nuclease [Acidobacteriota bacterium]